MEGLTNPACGAQSRAYFERQVAIYHSVLVAGEAAGIFTLTAPAMVIARNLVALEDGYGYYVAVPGPASMPQLPSCSATPRSPSAARWRTPRHCHRQLRLAPAWPDPGNPPTAGLVPTPERAVMPG